MKKVKGVFIADGKELPENSYGTGLVLEMEDGSFFMQHSTDPVQPFSEFTPKIVEPKRKLSAHSFPAIYEGLGINLSKLGCVMADLEPLSNMYSIEFEGAAVALYSAKNPERFWIDGWVADKSPHITLLYGFMESAQNLRIPIGTLLADINLEEVEIDHIGYFESPYVDEPYYCLVAHIKRTPELLEAHARLQFLPHVNTYPEYNPHMTIAYVDMKVGAAYRDRLIENFNSLWAGKKLKVKPELNFGGNKE